MSKLVNTTYRNWFRATLTLILLSYAHAEALCNDGVQPLSDNLSPHFEVGVPKTEAPRMEADAGSAGYVRLV